MDAAMTCFAENGYHVTTMEDIAAELRISKGLLYYYFKTKRDLFLAILENWMETARTGWSMLLASGEDAANTLQQCLTFGVELLAHSADLARVEFEFYSEVQRDAVIAEALQGLFTEFRLEFEQILAAGVERGQFRPMNVKAQAAILFGVYEGLAIQAMVEPNAFDWGKVGQELFETVMDGLSPRHEE
jgi:AcrR family transcriptional regulator